MKGGQNGLGWCDGEGSRLPFSSMGMMPWAGGCRGEVHDSIWSAPRTEMKDEPVGPETVLKAITEAYRPRQPKVPALWAKRMTRIY